MDYEAFVARKGSSTRFPGIEVVADSLNPSLFPHQRDLTRWALRKGRSAVFAQTGLGKSRVFCEWANVVEKMANGRVLILSPLAVGPQIVREATALGVEAAFMKRDDGKTRIVVTNYDNLAHFDPRAFVGVVLDESSILKSYDGATRTALIEAFAATPFRLSATATPAPNDFTELGNQCEFLGVRSRTEMLAEYFVHDGATTQEWRLKGHAVRAFWQWLATWGAVVNSPADLGHDASAYELPPLVEVDRVIPTDHKTAWATGALFAEAAVGLAAQRSVRRVTTPQRVEIAAEIAARPGPCIVWCELNPESTACTKAIKDAVEVTGAMPADEKEARLLAFSEGRERVLITKASIAGWGLNWQHCSRMIFLGASHSYEGRYQATRRCWRFGQKSPVEVTTIRTETEQGVVDNYKRKAAEAEKLGREMAELVGDAVRAEVLGATTREWNPHNAVATMTIPSWMRA